MPAGFLIRMLIVSIAAYAAEKAREAVYRTHRCGCGIIKWREGEDQHSQMQKVKSTPLIIYGEGIGIKSKKAFIEKDDYDREPEVTVIYAAKGREDIDSSPLMRQSKPAALRQSGRENKRIR